MEFGDNLKAAREAKGYTQQDIAKIMGIDKSTYCGYETGKRKPDVAKIKELSRILGVSGDYLLGTGFEGKPKDILDEIDVAFYGDYKELSEADKATLRDMAQLMRNRRESK